VTVRARVRKVSFTVRVLTATYWPLVLTIRYDTIRDAILTCARKPT